MLARRSPVGLAISVKVARVKAARAKVVRAQEADVAICPRAHATPILAAHSTKATAASKARVPAARIQVARAQEADAAICPRAHATHSTAAHTTKATAVTKAMAAKVAKVQVARVQAADAAIIFLRQHASPITAAHSIKAGAATAVKVQKYITTDHTTSHHSHQPTIMKLHNMHRISIPPRAPISMVFNISLLIIPSSTVTLTLLHKKEAPWL